MKKTIQIGDKVLTIKYQDLGEELNVDELLQIQYNRLPSEIVTFPVILNKLALLVADTENKVREAELGLEIFVAQKREKIREQLHHENTGLPRGEKMTQEDLKVEQESLLKSSPDFKIHNQRVNSAKRDNDYIKALYWSAKSKIDLLTKLSEKVLREDLESDLIDISDNLFNGVIMKIREPLIR